jgi:RNA polymerase sigma-70 factor (ECF subfamily)
MTPALFDYTNLLQRLQQHDLDAFNILYSRSRKRLFVLAYSITADDAVSKDIVQDFFIDFWENRRYEHIKQSLEGYLIFAIRNKALKYNRAQASLLKKAQSMPLPAAVAATHVIEHRELEREIDQAISLLPPMAGKVFRLHYLEHLSHLQIAEQLGISKSTVSSHMDRALKELRVTLRNTGI